MTGIPHSLAAAKALAKKLRQDLANEGNLVGHSEALERLALQYGYKDWNALHAGITRDEVHPWAQGDEVRGRYLSQPFTARIVASRMLRPGWYRVSLDLDEAVDVVQFDSFSNLRKRVQCTIGPHGTTKEKTSDGVPQVVLEAVHPTPKTLE